MEILKLEERERLAALTGRLHSIFEELNGLADALHELSTRATVEAASTALDLQGAATANAADRVWSVWHYLALHDFNGKPVNHE